ncbi:MAG: nucleoside hydrolase [Thermomicrobiales bacterium]
MSERRHLVLDVDVGIDDALMMLMFLGEPSVEIVAVGSTHGNCTAADAALNALRVLEACGVRDVPVALGLESPLAVPHKASHVHGNDGLADLGLPLPKGAVTGEAAPDQLVRLGNEQPGELDLIAVGALTNLAAALALDPDALKRFRSVTWLGGVSQRARVEDGYFDANALSDPGAATSVFSSDAPVTVVPIDLSYQAVPGRSAPGGDSHRNDAASAVRLADFAVLQRFLRNAVGPLEFVHARSDCRGDCDRSDFRHICGDAVGDHGTVRGSGTRMDNGEVDGAPQNGS